MSQDGAFTKLNTSPSKCSIREILLWYQRNESRLLISASVLLMLFFFLFLRQPLSVSYIQDNVESYEELGIRSKHEEQPSTTPPPSLSQKLKLLLRCKDQQLQMERVRWGSYWLVRNFVIGSLSRNMGCSESITYTTNGDYTFFDSLASVVQRWLAPVSFAIFAPGYDINGTLESIQYVRNCLPESELIRQYVTFHIFFPENHMPPVLPLSEKEALRWPFNCDRALSPPYMNVPREQMYKTEQNLTYPINVGRNIARRSANTYFVFACDIELFPSPGLVEKFLEMVERNHSVVSTVDKPRVFPLPVFELRKNATLPGTKEELRRMLKTEMAIPFHSKICAKCHLVPNQTEWLNTTVGNEISVLVSAKRHRNFRYWEPFYISDNKEPLFDERVTWEGQSNKRIQGLAMCLLDYEYHVLNDGFLVHSPGIKYFDKKSPRLLYVKAMNQLIKTVIQPEYNILYGKNKLCGV